MFGRKKKKEEPIVQQEYQPETIEVSDDGMEIDQENPIYNTDKPVSAPPVQQVQQVENSLPSLQESQVQPKPVTVQPTGGQARIEAAELVSVNGKQFYRFVLLSNKSIGEVGETLPLD
jgi:hypothetical protein|tara:strand:+ start:731 stop:1084 length:354 start_codon:yes stop_codon:yes gene_type:complete